MADQLRRDRVIAKGTGAPPDDLADPMYLKELHLQCEFALGAYGELRIRVAAGSTDLVMLAFAHMLLVFAGNAAKLVFPSPRATTVTTNRAIRLRAKLGIPDGAPVGLVDARNYFEHFDERMDRLLESHDGLLIHRLIVPVVSEQVELDDGRRFKARYLQLLQTASLELTLYDQTIKLPELAQEVELLGKNAAEALTRLGDRKDAKKGR